MRIPCRYVLALVLALILVPTEAELKERPDSLSMPPIKKQNHAFRSLKDLEFVSTLFSDSN